MIHTDTTADAFMRRVLANPADPLPRLVFADWLEETCTSSNMAWARYLRLADELANVPLDDYRRPKLRDTLDRTAGCIRARLTFRAEVFVAHPETMWLVLPIRNLILNLATVFAPPDLIESLPVSLAHEYAVLPLALVGNTVYVAAGDELNREQCQRLGYVLNRTIVPVRSNPEELRAAIDRHYGSAETWDYLPVMPMVVPGPGLRPDAELPVARLVTLLISDAIVGRATAVELEPTTLAMRIWQHFGTERRVRDVQGRRYLPAILTRLRELGGPNGTLNEFTATLVIRGLPYQLNVRIADTPAGPHILIGIPPLNPEPPAAALNPAA